MRGTRSETGEASRGSKDRGLELSSIKYPAIAREASRDAVHRALQGHELQIQQNSQSRAQLLHLLASRGLGPAASFGNIHDTILILTGGKC
jgi:hypothetical protein